LSPESGYGLNPYQKWAFECWKDMWRRVGKVDLVIHGGDEIDGKQKKSDGVGLVTASLKEQTEIFIDLVKPHLQQIGVQVRVTGSPYHVGHDDPLALADASLGIRLLGVNGDLEVAPSVIMNIAHQMEGGSALYMGTKMDRETLWRSIQEYEHAFGRAKVLDRHHNHMFAESRFHGKQIVLVPTWKAQDGHAKLRGQHRWVPKIGAALYEWNETWECYDVREVTYALPECERKVWKLGRLGSSVKSFAECSEVSPAEHN
jgi:hypothetical protein